MEQPILKIYKLCENATTPVRATPDSAGCDLFAAESVTIPALGRVKVKTGIALGIPGGYYGKISPRSGLGANYGVVAQDGTIDRDYTGDVTVLLFNHSDEPYTGKF